MPTATTAPKKASRARMAAVTVSESRSRVVALNGFTSSMVRKARSGGQGRGWNVDGTFASTAACTTAAGWRHGVRPQRAAGAGTGRVPGPSPRYGPRASGGEHGRAPRRVPRELLHARRGRALSHGHGVEVAGGRGQGRRRLPGGRGRPRPPRRLERAGDRRGGRAVRPAGDRRRRRRGPADV